MKQIEATEKVIFVCDGKKCGKYSKGIRKSFKHLAKEHGMKRDIEIVCMGCTDNCKTAPNICLQPQNVWIGEVDENEISSIFNKYIIPTEQTNSNEPGNT